MAEADEHSAPSPQGQTALLSHKASKLRGYACMTASQLGELCGSLEKSRSTTEKLLEQLLNEQSKLKSHRGTLQQRIAEVESSLTVNRASSGTRTEVAPAGSQTVVRTFDGDVAAGEGGAAEAEAVASETKAQPGQILAVKARAAAAGSDLSGAGQLLDLRQLAAQGGTRLGAGPGGGTRRRPEGEPRRPEGPAPTLSSSSSSRAPAIPEVPSFKEARQEFVREVLSVARVCAGDLHSSDVACILWRPEELMARPGAAPGCARLTWFYDEALLESFAELGASGTRRLVFEVRQQSEGANGRMRTRLHNCPCQLPARGEEVLEQGFVVEGCAGGRAYSFSVRARLEINGKEASASEFCDPVNLSLPGGGTANLGSYVPPSLATTVASVSSLSSAAAACRTASGPVQATDAAAKETGPVTANGMSAQQAAPAACQSLTETASFLRQWLQDHKLVSAEKLAAPAEALSPRGWAQESRASVAGPRTTSMATAAVLSQPRPLGTLNVSSTLPAPILTGLAEELSPNDSPPSPNDSAGSFLRQWLQDRERVKAAEQQAHSQESFSPTSGANLGKPVLQVPSAGAPTPASGSLARATWVRERASIAQNILQKAYTEDADSTNGISGNGQFASPYRQFPGQAVSPGQHRSEAVENDLDATLPPQNERFLGVIGQVASPVGVRGGISSCLSPNSPAVGSEKTVMQLSPAHQEHNIAAAGALEEAAQDLQRRFLAGAEQSHEVNKAFGVPRSRSLDRDNRRYIAEAQNAGPSYFPQQLQQQQQPSAFARQLSPARRRVEGSYTAAPMVPPAARTTQMLVPRSASEAESSVYQAIVGGPAPQIYRAGYSAALSHSTSFPMQFAPQAQSQVSQELGSTRPLQASHQAAAGLPNQGQQVSLQGPCGQLVYSQAAAASASLQTIGSLPGPQQGGRLAAPQRPLLGAPGSDQFQGVPQQVGQSLGPCPLSDTAPLFRHGLAPGSHNLPPGPGALGSFQTSFGSSSFGAQRPFGFGGMQGFAAAAEAHRAPEGRGRQSFQPVASLGYLQQEQTLDEAPPPRSAPGFEQPLPRSFHASSGSGDFPRWNDPPQANGLGHGPSSSCPGGSGMQHVLQIRMADNHWESLNFSTGDDLQRAGGQFIQHHGLKAAFTPGLLARMQQMITMGQDYGCADIVDLI